MKILVNVDTTDLCSSERNYLLYNGFRKFDCVDEGAELPWLSRSYDLDDFSELAGLITIVNINREIKK